MHQCEFFLLRYVPDLVKDEFVNIGLVLSESKTNFADVRFTTDWSRARCLNVEADIEILEAVHSDIRKLLAAGGASRESIFKIINDSFSNTIQLSPLKACVTASPQQEIEELAKLYLESSRPRRTSRPRSTRQEIVVRMQEGFENAGIWAHLWKNVPASRYTHNGDTLKIDCGYKPNGVVRLFHALSPATDPDSAKVLAFSFPQIAEGIYRVERATTELTAIVPQLPEQRDESLQFALATLEHNSIQIAAVSEIPAIADRARRELQV
jgi:Protein of unknown function (DUF3037)